ncbi:SnoaL-like domain [Aquimarina spongiae]|uniref:SnoaL-like domain n=2 Tax=Aquimarina spongiae TaxID=570521 RepID=A0A1M6IRK5_9FLAO|nr:SnoaL-like domain [Aquimarina spongiae]
MRCLWIFIVFGVLISCKKNDTMQNEQKRMIENYVNSYNNFDVEGMIRDLDQDIIFENYKGDTLDLKIEGLDGFIKQAESATSFFKERKQTITSWQFDTDLVRITIDYEGILAVDLPNGMKSGDTLQLKGVSEFTFKGNKISSIKDKS